jgi:hypothetical protein
MAPAWTEFHQTRKDDINVAKVDCTSEEGKPLCQRFDIRGYPSVLYFPKDEELTGKYIKH